MRHGAKTTAGAAIRVKKLVEPVETMIMKQSRVSPGRVITWRLALAELRGIWPSCVLPVLLTTALVVLLLVLPVPRYEAGLISGILVTMLAGTILWRMWAVGGLTDRMQGTWAEDWTHEELRGSKAVLEVIPSLKFDRIDVDHVAITPAGVWGIETKFHRAELTDRRLDDDAYQAARAARTLRHQMKGRGMPSDLVKPLLVLWGPGCRTRGACEVQTNLGSVSVVRGRDLDAWLKTARAGPVGTDYAEDLARDLTALAVSRDAANNDAGLLLRWLARAR